MAHLDQYLVAKEAFQRHHGVIRSVLPHKVRPLVCWYLVDSVSESLLYTVWYFISYLVGVAMDKTD